VEQNKQSIYSRIMFLWALSLKTCNDANNPISLFCTLSFNQGHKVVQFLACNGSHAHLELKKLWEYQYYWRSSNMQMQLPMSNFLRYSTMEKLIDLSFVKFYHRFEVTLLMLKEMLACRLYDFTFRHGDGQFHRLKLVPMNTKMKIIIFYTRREGQFFGCYLSWWFTQVRRRK